MKNVDMDESYRRTPQEEIPWNMEKPPKELTRLVEGGKVLPCKTIDMGCGAGNYAIYLAGKGFDVTGVDISATAVKIAEDNARKRGVTCKFTAADLLGDLREVEGTFDFAYDWEVLHHIYPEQSMRYQDWPVLLPCPVLPPGRSCTR